MPLARIISTSAKYSDGLADDLRSRGFQVLTSAPGDRVSESADLEITLKECLADEARVTTDAADTKDMRVFLTPQAFAGKIRSIEMFVLTPQRAAVQMLEMETLVATPVDTTSGGLGNMLEFIAPAEVVSSPASAPVETDPSIDASEEVTAAIEETDEPGFASAGEIVPIAGPAPSDSQSTIGRAILASKQSAWPDMAEMKLVPAELVPAFVKPVGTTPQSVPLPVRIPVASVPTETHRDTRFWKAPIAVSIAAILALSGIWLANRVSASHSQAGTSLQQAAPSSVEAATPAATIPVNNPSAAISDTSSVVVDQAKSARKFVRTSAVTRPRAQHSRAKRRNIPESDYVAKDTTVYFSGKSADQQAGQKPQARP